MSLLQQNTVQLVDDSDLANVIFKAVHGQVPADVEETLFQAAHLESRQPLQHDLLYKAFKSAFKSVQNAFKDLFGHFQECRL